MDDNKTSARLCVVVFGATGLFGALLVRRLASDPCIDVVGVARRIGPLRNLQTENPITVEVLDRAVGEQVESLLRRYRPFAVIDCAGPFQYYGDDPYRFARCVVKAGCHYLDIADASDFVDGIGVLDDLAREHAVVAISGVSTAPTISAAATDFLLYEFEGSSIDKVIGIESAIIPGNRARRTLSVMKAILGQIGKPFEITRHGRPTTVFGWSETQTINMALPAHKPVRGRLASLVHTPEVAIFPGRYNAQTVTVRAGLELKPFHRILQFGGWLVRIGAISTLATFTGQARWLASWFETVGSDVGGMQVRITGVSRASGVTHRTWELIATDGDGPEIPTLPVSALLLKLRHATVCSGARSGCGEISLTDLEPWFQSISARTISYAEPCPTLFKTALDASFDRLPESVRELHSCVGQRAYRGSAVSKGPSGFSGRLVAWLFGFPGASEKVPVTVTLTADGTKEVWQRNFDGRIFTSTLSLGPGNVVTERFGPIAMQLGLHVRDNALYFPVVGARLFGVVPIPAFLLPRSIASESEDEAGRFNFDVHLLTPFGARIAHYSGWLV